MNSQAKPLARLVRKQGHNLDTARLVDIARGLSRFCFEKFSNDRARIILDEPNPERRSLNDINWPGFRLTQRELEHFCAEAVSEFGVARFRTGNEELACAPQGR